MCQLRNKPNIDNNWYDAFAFLYGTNKIDALENLQTLYFCGNFARAFLYG